MAANDPPDLSKLWVDEADYTGPDRRSGRRQFRLRERRGVQTAREPPALHTGVRVLSLALLELNDAAAVERFRRRARALAGLAAARGNRPLAAELSALAGARAASTQQFASIAEASMMRAMQML